MTLPESIETSLNVGKGAAFATHLKNNRIEYLVVLVLSHLLGITDVIISKASGVCGL